MQSTILGVHFLGFRPVPSRLPNILRTRMKKKKKIRNKHSTFTSGHPCNDWLFENCKSWSQPSLFVFQKHFHKQHYDLAFWKSWRASQPDHQQNESHKWTSSSKGVSYNPHVVPLEEILELSSIDSEGHHQRCRYRRTPKIHTRRWHTRLRDPDGWICERLW